MLFKGFQGRTLFWVKGYGLIIFSGSLLLELRRTTALKQMVLETPKNGFPLNIIGILIVKPLTGAGLLIMGFHCLL